MSDRVEIETADMRQIPFPEATFDVVVSSWAVHNLYDPKERGQAVREIVRVLKPGGVALIKDIRHGAQYRASSRSRLPRRPARGQPPGEFAGHGGDVGLRPPLHPDGEKPTPRDRACRQVRPLFPARGT